MRYLSLDVGMKRIGVASADDAVRIACRQATLENDNLVFQKIADFVQNVDMIVIGYPRNQSGEATAQTQNVVEFADQLKLVCPNKKIVFQDESLTSVLAEKRLSGGKKPFSKGDIDAEAACIILEDYLGRIT